MNSQHTPLHPEFLHELGLPHAKPFIFVDRIIACDGKGTAECEVVFPAEHPMFAGHFPGNPLVPGVILTEALAQTAGIAAASEQPQGAKPLFLLSAIRAMKFLRPVRPGERVSLRAEKVGEMQDLLQFKVVARVSDLGVAEGQIILSVATRRKNPGSQNAGA